MILSLFNRILIQFGINLSNIKNVSHLLMLILVLQQVQVSTQELSPEQNEKLRVQIRYLKEHHMESMSDEWIILANKYEKKLLTLSETKQLSDTTVEVDDQFVAIAKLTQVVSHMYDVYMLSKNIDSLIRVGVNNLKFAQLNVQMKSLEARDQEANKIINQFYSTTDTKEARELLKQLNLHIQKTRKVEYKQTMETIGKFKEDILGDIANLEFWQKVNYFVEAAVVLAAAATTYYTSERGIAEYKKHSKEQTSILNKESMTSVGAPLAATGLMVGVGAVVYSNIQDNEKLKRLFAEQYDRLVKVGEDVMKLGGVIDSDEVWIKGEGRERLEELIVSRSEL